MFNSTYVLQNELQTVSIRTIPESDLTVWKELEKYIYNVDNYLTCCQIHTMRNLAWAAGHSNPLNLQPS